MRQMRYAKRFVDRILDALVTTIFAGMTGLTILLVILRYFFSTSIPGGHEALRFGFMFTTFLGAAVLIGRHQHISIHLVTKRLPPRLQRVAAVLENWIIIAMHVYLLVLSFRWMAVTGGNLAEELKFPLRYVQVALPIGTVLASLYAFSNSIEAIFDRNWGKEPTE